MNDDDAKCSEAASLVEILCEYVGFCAIEHADNITLFVPSAEYKLRCILALMCD